jgi:hypothetical protein
VVRYASSVSAGSVSAHACGLVRPHQSPALPLIPSHPAIAVAVRVTSLLACRPAPPPRASCLSQTRGRHRAAAAMDSSALLEVYRRDRCHLLGFLLSAGGRAVDLSRVDLDAVSGDYAVECIASGKAVSTASAPAATARLVFDRGV